MKLTTSTPQEAFCLFLVGMQCRSWKSFWKVPLIGSRMGKMQKELMQDPNSGLIWGKNFTSWSPFTTLFLSYWKSSEHIHQFTNSKRFSHVSSSGNYSKRFGKDPYLGVWHETYEIDPNKSENLYLGMAPFGVSAFIEPAALTDSNRNYLRRLKKQ